MDTTFKIDHKSFNKLLMSSEPSSEVWRSVFEAAGSNFHGFQKIWCQWEDFLSVMPLECKNSGFSLRFWRQWAQNLKKSALKYYFYILWTAGGGQRGPPIIQTQRKQCKHSKNMCKLMPQCFQIWQVSAKYCTFLDFLPSVMPFVHKSFWSTHQC